MSRGRRFTDHLTRNIMEIIIEVLGILTILYVTIKRK